MFSESNDSHVYVKQMDNNPTKLTNSRTQHPMLKSIENILCDPEDYTARWGREAENNPVSAFKSYADDKHLILHGDPSSFCN